MGVINTEAWLEEFGEQPIKLCEKLKIYFAGLDEREIYQYLCLFGMYKPSIFTRENLISQFRAENYIDVVQKEFNQLRKKWNGPDIPVFIFPVNERQSHIMRENKGKSGIAFNNKLFLFLASKLEHEEIKALLTHEYHHVCRLQYMNKKEEEITLLDTILLEGLAEHAVIENCGKEYTAYWTKLYSQEQLKKWWKELINPNLDKHKHEKGYYELIYGQKSYPHMLGYCMGFYIINVCMKSHNCSLKMIEKMSSNKILQLFSSS